MNSRERILAAIRHEETDRVPIAPRVWAWLLAEYGAQDIATYLKAFPHMDMMLQADCGTPNIIDEFPEGYSLPQVKVDQRKYSEGDFTVTERTFHTPAGMLSDRLMIPPSGREFGVSPNPFRTEHLVKSSDDLAALRYLLAPVNTNFDFLTALDHQMGDRGVNMVTVRSPLDHNAGHAREMQDLMVDYYDNRPFFDELFNLFQQHSLAQIKAAMEGGAQFIFGVWYFASLSTGWSPAIFKEVFVPYLREQVELTHRYGGYFVYYDDGKLSQSMELIASAGVDVLETCTPPPTGDFDLALAKQVIGEKTTLKGYIDLLHVVKNGTPELIDQAVKQAMEIGKPGGGFIIGSSDSFRDGTPRENVDAYFAACLRHGGY